MIILAFLVQTLRIATPYLLAASGGVLSERAGIIALTLEGWMLTGAFCAALGSFYAQSAWVGLLCGVAGGVAAAALHALASIRYRANQVVVGIAINLLASRDFSSASRLTAHPTRRAWTDSTGTCPPATLHPSRSGCWRRWSIRL
jgi:ABC-type uncharacterized transport system permease subunit